MTLESASCRRFISAGDTSCPPTEMPVMRPVSWVGKKPFGIVTNITAVTAMVARNTQSVTTLVAEHDVEAAPVGREHRRRSRVR